MWPVDDPTLPFHRRVILAASTVQTFNRLFYDFEPLLIGDPRLLVRYAVYDDHRQDTAHAFARRHGIEPIDLDDLRKDPPDLVVAAGAQQSLHELGAPLALLPHGAGHNRLRPEYDGVADLARNQLVGPDGELPAFIALPGAAAAERLAVDCAEAAANAEVTGDLCFERLLASRAMRREYRRALGVGPGRRLVVVSSTWLGHSLFAHHPELPERLLASLPMDEYAVAFVPHPNILAVHGGMESLFRRRLENGLIMVDPDEGWRATVSAADCVIGDHGSVTFYAAALGIPTAAAAFGYAEMPPDSPLARFGRLAPRFDATGDLLGQVEGLCAVNPLEDECFARALAVPERPPSTLIRSRLYGLLGLSEPAAPSPRMIPEAKPVAPWRRTSSWRCEVDSASLAWRRFPHEGGGRGAGHLVAEVRCLDRAARESADIVLRHHDPLTEDEARQECSRLLDEHPVASLASVSTGPGTFVWADSGGLVLRVRCPERYADAAPSIWFETGRGGAWLAAEPLS